ncbi:PREDICTED: uncharacterized protein LOC109219451 [Nicotiana attenuata]|uniref:uncharacterized protein LOC109219451 n=1 Tax=Nicotiana attenuata TaxID=49451 RepID=UPI00090486DC|nr:PREDICTED: uncharacterized protein LOC109219451 [Nicotiana attenuata]
MEYLQREFMQMMKRNDFKFHPRCKKLGVVHVCFADDLLMFCKADIQSVRLLKQTFQKFSKASGLQANAEKSAVYIAGVSNWHREEILQELGFPEGCLNVMNLLVWNKATIAKHLWAVAKKKDSLWIKWLHIYYIKNHSIEDMPTPRNAAWVVRKIVELRKMINELQGIQGNLESRLIQLQRGELFSIKKLYRLQYPHYQKVQWKSIMLQAHIHPRYKFILWLALHSRLATVDRLLKFGIQVPQQCIFCGLAIETFDHLFFECSLTKALWNRLLRWLGYHRPIYDWQHEVEWVSKNAKRRNGLAAITTCVFGMLVNAIWRERNKQRFQGGRLLSNNICKEIAIHIHMKGTSIHDWKEALLSLNSYP